MMAGTAQPQRPTHRPVRRRIVVVNQQAAVADGPEFVLDQVRQVEGHPADAQGRVYVTDGAKHAVLVFDRTDSPVWAAGTYALMRPDDWSRA